MHFILYIFQNSNFCDMLSVGSLTKNYLHIAFYQIERCLEVDKEF